MVRNVCGAVECAWWVCFEATHQRCDQSQRRAGGSSTHRRTPAAPRTLFLAFPGRFLAPLPLPRPSKAGISRLRAVWDGRPHAGLTWLASVVKHWMQLPCVPSLCASAASCTPLLLFQQRPREHRACLPCCAACDAVCPAWLTAHPRTLWMGCSAGPAPLQGPSEHLLRLLWLTCARLRLLGRNLPFRSSPASPSKQDSQQ